MSEPTQAQTEVLDIIEEFLEETLGLFDVGDDFEVDMQFRDDQLIVRLEGDEDDVALTIGKRGQTLDALQYIANALVMSGAEEPVQVVFDAQGYRERRRSQLEKVADRAVAEVLRSGRSVELEAMTSSERKAVHMYLKDHADVGTESTGREPDRRVTIVPRED